jgi:hypothetical protein
MRCLGAQIEHSFDHGFLRLSVDMLWQRGAVFWGSIENWMARIMKEQGEGEVIGRLMLLPASARHVAGHPL